MELPPSAQYFKDQDGDIWVFASRRAEIARLIYHDPRGRLVGQAPGTFRRAAMVKVPRWHGATLSHSEVLGLLDLAPTLVDELVAALTEYVERHEAECDPTGLPEYEQARKALARAGKVKASEVARQGVFVVQGVRSGASQTRGA